MSYFFSFHILTCYKMKSALPLGEFQMPLFCVLVNKTIILYFLSWTSAEDNMESYALSFNISS